MAQFSPQVLLTTDIKETLTLFTQNNNISIKDINFDIINYATYYTKLGSKKWNTLTAQTKEPLMHIKFMTDKNIYYKEQYKIKVYPKLSIKGCTPSIKLISNPSKTKVILLLKSDTVFTPTKTCFAEFVHEVKRKLSYSGYLLGLFTFNIEKALQTLIAHQKEFGKISNDLKIVISTAFEPQTTTSGVFIAHYLQKNEDQRSAYEEGVDENELIAEYVFPHIGLGGRDCTGNYLKPYGPTIYQNELIFYDETVKRVFEKNRILFYALRSGYVEYTEQKIHVSKTLKLESAAFNTTGSITLGGHRDIHLAIQSNDALEDAIDKGVNIDVSSIDVRGSVAGNTNIKADSVKIGAQTHKSTQIEAKDGASVYLHRGNLKAKDANIAKLEHGMIEAETVRVREVLGGEIRAKKIYVNVLYSNAKLIASEYIEIMRIEGEHNKIIIAPQKIENQEIVIQTIENDIKKIRDLYREITQTLEEFSKNFTLNYSRIEVFKQQVVDALNAGKNPPRAASIRVKQYTLDKKRIDSLHAELEAQHKLLRERENDLERQKNIISYAQIILKSSWDGKQELIFEDTASAKIEKYIPNGFIKEITYPKINKKDLITIVEG